MAGLEALRSDLVRRASDYADGATGTAGGSGIHRVLPVLPELSWVLPSRGLRRGSTIAVLPGRSWPAGGSSLVLALLAEASRSGSWCAVVGVPTFGAVAAAQAGIALERLALVPHPGPEWPTVVAALIDGVDVVVSAVPAAVSGSIAGRLGARARQRGCVFVAYGQWEGADVTLQVLRGAWEGLGQGHGRLRRRRLVISARGRGAASRPREVEVWLPAAAGRLGAVVGDQAPTPTGGGRPALTLVTGLAEVDAVDAIEEAV
ncbi:MAG TPA: hypothetical protein VFR67_12550 [Pilimelia sp.]|nr:hypothetical protein [Pilimelia sp.]